MRGTWGLTDWIFDGSEWVGDEEGVTDGVDVCDISVVFDKTLEVAGSAVTSDFKNFTTPDISTIFEEKPFTVSLPLL